MGKIKVRENTPAYVDFDGDSLLRLKNQVDEWIKTYGEEAFIDRQSVPYEDYYEYKLCVYREETDEEYQRRIEIAKERETRDRQHYERLKKKFEDT